MGALQRAPSRSAATEGEKHEEAGCQRARPQPPRSISPPRRALYRKRLINEYPAVPQDRHGPLPVRVLAARPGQARRGAEALPDHPGQVPASRVPPRRLDGDRRVPLLRAAELQELARGYEKVLKHPESPLYDLALFKTAWCYWKLGDTNKAALRFKDVLDLGRGRRRARAEADRAEARRRAARAGARLPGRAVHRGRHKSAQGRVRVPGPDRRQAVLAQGASSSWPTRSSTRRATSAPSRPTLPHRARPQRRRGARPPGGSSRRYQLLGDTKTAVAEMRKLAATYGARQRLGQRQQGCPKAVEHARDAGASVLRNLAKTMHAEAQQTRRRTKVVDKDRYARAAEAYEFYLANFPDAADAVELRYLRADILYFKLGSTRRPGASTWPSASRSRSASTTRTRCCRRWARREGARKRRGTAAEAATSPTRPPVRRGGRSLRDAVPEGQGDRHRHLQERPVLLRLRRLRRGGQALRPDRRALPRRSERRRRRRPHPGGAQQGQGLREHRELGAAPKSQGVLVAGRAGAPGQADRRLGHEVGREVRGDGTWRGGVLPARGRASSRRARGRPRR